MQTRLINAAIVGWSGDSPATRCIGYGAPKPNFWREFYKGNLLDRRATNPMLPHLTWNPGGCLPGEYMQFTQMLQAEKAGLSWLFEDLDRTILDYAHNCGRLGFYLGGEQQDRILKTYYANSTKDRLIRDATKHFPRCVAIAVDGASGSAKDSRVLRWMNMERDAGREVMIEAMPAHDYLEHFPAIFMTWFEEHYREWPGVRPSKAENILFNPDRWLMPSDASEAAGKGYSLCGPIHPSNWLGIAPLARHRQAMGFSSFVKHYRAAYGSEPDHRAHIAKRPQR
jgi:hypothetical protein